MGHSLGAGSLADECNYFKINFDFNWVLGHSQEVSEVKLDAKIFKMSNLHFYLPGLEAIKSHYCLFNILVGRNVSI